MNEGYKATHCRICGGKILALSELNRVPIIDPYTSAYSNELLSLIGAPVHITCWAQHPLWQEVARLAMADSRLMFRDGRALLDAEYAGAWVKTPVGSPSETGALFLPRSAYVYNNLLGADVKGGFASGAAEDVLLMVKFLRFVKSGGCIEVVHQAVPEISIESTPQGSSVFLGFGDPERMRINLYLDDVELIAERPSKSTGSGLSI